MSETETVDGTAGPQSDPGRSTDFSNLNLSDSVCTGIQDLGYVRPTEVQSAVLPVALAGRDLVVQSKTGSGKTSAFGIPMVERLTAQGAEPGAPLGLILVPTRELATQVARELGTLGEAKGLRVHAIYGGVSIGRQASALKEGVELVVGTPGRLLDHIRRKNMSLSGIQIIALDEADEMLSMGFWDDVTDLVKMCPDNRQTMLFSATLPYQVAKAAAQFLKEPERVDLSGDVLTVEGIENCYAMVQADIPKPRQLLYILEVQKPTSAVVFCNTRNETEILAKYLTQAGFMAEALAGNLKQRDRERVMGRIKAGELRYMVATDIASRGIDITDLSHVVNYSLPEFPEVYLHRVGRTGRIGKTGVAISLVDGKGLSTLTKLQREFGIELNEKPLPQESEVLAVRSQRIMNELAEKASVAEVGQHIPVAKEILETEDAPQVIAYLLKCYFSSAAENTVKRAPRKAEEASTNGASAAPEDDAADGDGKTRRRRRRRRGRRRRGGEGEQLETMDAAEALATGNGAVKEPAAEPEGVNGNAPKNGHAAAVAVEPAEKGFSRIRVNIGFDDGFKGRGAVAKKIASLAGLNDGTITEVESRRGHAVLKAKSEIAELLVERCDGAQIGKKILSIAVQ